MSAPDYRPPAERATEVQLESLRALLSLALEEEPDDWRKAKLEQLRRDSLRGLSFRAVRTMVTDLHAQALPGGELEASAGAWLARRENGGTA